MNVAKISRGKVAIHANRDGQAACTVWTSSDAYREIEGEITCKKCLALVAKEEAAAALVAATDGVKAVPMVPAAERVKATETVEITPLAAPTVEQVQTARDEAAEIFADLDAAPSLADRLIAEAEAATRAAVADAMTTGVLTIEVDMVSPDRGLVTAPFGYGSVFRRNGLWDAENEWGETVARGAASEVAAVTALALSEDVTGAVRIQIHTEYDDED